MKKVLLVALALLAFIPGCSQKKITEREFSVIWEEYMRREFEESFDEKQSLAQKEKVMSEILSRVRIPVEDFKEYMKNNHNDKYKKVFIK
ncbi:MAG: hypothetical protein JW864_11045 [Spirochaetes bacterium]|nr:hypothetical protein [Spirochaetota bacterium]